MGQEIDCIQANNQRDFGSVNRLEVFGSQKFELFIRKQLVQGGNTELFSNKLSGMKTVTLKIKKLVDFFGIPLAFYVWHEVSLVIRIKRKPNIKVIQEVQISKFIRHMSGSFVAVTERENSRKREYCNRFWEVSEKCRKESSNNTKA